MWTGLARLFGRAEYPELQAAIVNLRSGTAIRGIIYRQAGGYLVLRQAELLQDREQPKLAGPVGVDGEVLVRLTEIDFIQVLP